jgi:HD superfamily phosphohydrolase
VADEFRYKIICDPVHGEIPISAVEQKLIDSPSFQRLRYLKQLGLASLVYPNATHTRFAHSLGVFRIMSRVIDLLVGKGNFNDDDRRRMRIAALLHDIGHYPYSHLMEFVDLDKYRPSYLGGASQPAGTQVSRYPDHEKIGQVVITKRLDIASVLEGAGIDPEEIASIIRSEHTKPAYNRLIHSSLDMDRMDYMLRDSLGTGVPYGRIDLDYLLNNLEPVEEDGEFDVVVSHKAATAAEHFLIARYFMHKAVYFHKTTFGLEALLRHILFLMRQAGHIYRDGKDIEKLIETDDFLNFHDGYVDAQIQAFANKKGRDAIIHLCKALKERRPPKLLHQVSVLQEASQGMDANYALFTKDRVGRIKEMARKHKIPVERWIWEDPKDIKFESMGPFIPLADAADLKPGETAEMIRVRESDGTIRKLVEDQRSILHHLSKLRFRMSRLYLVGPVETDKFGQIVAEVKGWATL